MRNIKLKIFTILALVLLQTQAFCDIKGIGDSGSSSSGSSSSSSSSSSGGGGGSSGGIIAAIQALQIAVVNALQGSGPSSVVNALNKIFVADNNTVGSYASTNQSVIGKSVDMYATQFYNFYTNNSTSNDAEINNSSEINYNYNTANYNTGNTSNGDLIDIENRVKSGTNQLVKQDIYYASNKSLPAKFRDILALLLVKAEGGENNINASAVMNDGATVLSKMFSDNGKQKGSNEGSLYTDSYIINQINNQANEGIQNIMDVNVLIGPDGYSNDAAENAKIFINQLIQTSPAPKTFYFPSIGNATSGNKTIYLPYTDNNGNPTAVTLSLSKSDAASIGGVSQYQLMLNMLDANPLYQEYKMKFRSKMAMRTLYLSNLFRIFQNRYKGPTGRDRSLAEKEKYMAMNGLTQTYYNSLKTKSVADVNLETLHTLNKIVYFLYKLHQDNERSLLLTAVAGTTSQLLDDTQDEKKYFQPLGVLIRNGCWDSTYNTPSPLGANSDARKTACDNPTSSMAY